jgi:class 3 adenylate cyclase
MYIWTADAKTHEFPPNFVHHLCNRLWHLQHKFQQVVLKSADDVPLFELPQRIRFGLARGTVFELTHRNSTQTEYIGFCINLASRLQTYCPQIGFIASGAIGLTGLLTGKKSLYQGCR